ncbi:MAG: hypothetical protein ABIU29_02180 [Chthoniobacterales bacterium]
MIDPEDLKWLVANATDLHRLLQQTSRQAAHARLRHDEPAFLDSLSDQLERASRSSQAIFDRITARIMAGVGYASPVDTASASLGGRAGHNDLHENAGGRSGLNEEAPKDPLVFNPIGSRELILLVDDPADILLNTDEILDFEDYCFITAKDGIEAFIAGSDNRSTSC